MEGIGEGLISPVCSDCYRRNATSGNDSSPLDSLTFYVALLAPYFHWNDIMEVTVYCL